MTGKRLFDDKWRKGKISLLNNLSKATGASSCCSFQPWPAWGRAPEEKRTASAFCLLSKCANEITRALFSYTKTLITGFLAAPVLQERLFQSQLKCVLFEKIWFMAEVNPLTYPDNYSRSGFTGVTCSTHLIPDPSADDTVRQ